MATTAPVPASAVLAAAGWARTVKREQRDQERQSQHRPAADLDQQLRVLVEAECLTRQANDGADHHQNGGKARDREAKRDEIIRWMMPRSSSAS